MQFEILHADLTNHDIFIVHYSWTQPSRIRYRLQSTEKTVYTTHTAQCIPLMHACFCRVLRTFLRILPRIGTCIKVQIIYLYWTYSAHLWVDIYFYWRYCCAFGCRFGKCAFSRVCANILEYFFLKCKHFPIDIYMYPQNVDRTLPITTKWIQIQNILQCRYLYWKYSSNNMFFMFITTSP